MSNPTTENKTFLFDHEIADYCGIPLPIEAVAALRVKLPEDIKEATNVLETIRDALMIEPAHAKGEVGNNG